MLASVVAISPSVPVIPSANGVPTEGVNEILRGISIFEILEASSLLSLPQTLPGIQ
ncbi:MAG: hypothetical protein F6K09_20060 [Merismopedia sp. SIO2A8]|nr:hypothetical protein [Symploca sp. SIO2B6]NET50938.1 hypothetical protein [Merismopedia sp. SIO2A8]